MKTKDLIKKRELIAYLLNEEGVKYSSKGKISRRENPGDLPLSFAQQRLWFLEQLDGSGPAYNISLPVRIRGSLNLRALEQAFNEIIRRHDVLRSSFDAHLGHARQSVAPALRIRLPLTDISALPRHLRHAELLRLASRDAARPFDLARPPLLRASLVRLADDACGLLLTMHHIISDGWSTGVLLREMGRLYAAFSKGEPSPLAPLEIQYADFARWQREWLVGERLASQLAYWRTQLDGAPPVLELPTDRARPAVRSQRGARTGIWLPEAVGEVLRALSQREGVTLFMTLLAAFKVLLWRYTGQTEVVVGTPIAGRTRAEVEPLIGFFVNTLVLRSELRGEWTFREAVERVKEVCLGAYAHQDVPFEKLVEELQPERSLSHTPLFQVMFTLQQPQGAAVLGGAGEESGGLRLEPLETADETEKFDITLVVDEGGRQWQVVMGYRQDIFEEATVARMLAHYGQLLHSIATNPRQRLSALEMMSAAEREQVVRGWNRTGVAWTDTLAGDGAPPTAGDGAPARAETSAPVGLHHLIERQVARTPEAVALTFEGTHVTYGELNRRANQLAHHLRTLGIGAEVEVGVLMERSVEMVVGLLGILKAGGAYVPLDPTYPAARLAFMVADAGVPVVLTQRHLAGRAGDLGGVRVLVLDELAQVLGEQRGDNPDVELSGDNLAYMIYTSGSTGTPKGAMNTHRAISNRLLWMQQRYGLSDRDVVLQKTPFSFDVSVWEFFWPLLAGARLVVARAEGHRDAAYLVELIKGEGVTTLHFVPAMLQVFIEEEGVEGCASLKRVICSGEALTAELAGRCQERLVGAELHNLYGPTEAAVDVTAWECARGDGRGSVPIGRPIANTDIYILDGEMRAVAVGVAGELYIGGVGLARGYQGRAELTAERFVPDPYSEGGGGRLYRTGDVARYGAGGEIEYVGRMDHQVKVRGFRIELGEIESVLREQAGVAEAVVMAREEGGGEKRLVAYLLVEGAAAGTDGGDGAEAEAGSDDTTSVEAGTASEGRTSAARVRASEVRAYLRGRLPEYMVPQQYVMLTEWPLTGSGKVDRRALPAPEGGAAQVGGEYVAPRNEVERVLAEVWGEVLRVQEVGVNDNYFELGGDSIRSVSLLALARERGVSVTLQELFQHQTIGALAGALGRAAAERGGGARVAAGQEIVTERFSLISGEDRARMPEGVEDAYPLTMLQAGMLYHMALTPEVPLYHNVNSMRLKARLDMEALRESAAMVVRRHAALRTGFELSGYSEPLQLVYERAEMEIAEADIRGLSEAAAEQEVEAHVERERRRGFELRSAPLMRFFIHRRDEDTFQFTLTECHPIQDGWSLHTVLAEMFSHYFALVNGEPEPELEPVRVSYREYVRMEREALQSDEQRAYWNNKLADSTVLEIPRRESSREVQRQIANGDGHTDVRFRLIRISRELSNELKSLARSLGVPVKSVALAAHVKALSILSGQTDVLTGVVSNGRSEEKGGERTVGLFLNTLPFRQKITNGTWKELVRATFENEWELLPYRRYPMAALQNSRGGQQLYETAFNFIHFHVAESVVRSGNVEVLATKVSEGSNWTLQAHFSLGMDALQLELQLEYNSLELTAEQMDEIEGYYLNVLRAMAQDPLARHDYQNFLSPAEERRQLTEWNATERPYPLHLAFHQLFEHQVARAPQAPALISDHDQLSYQQLNERANQLAHFLRAHGIGPDSLVALLDDRSPALLVAIIAIFKAGGAYLPLDPHHPPARLAHIVAQSRTPLVLVAARYHALIDDALAAVPPAARPAVCDIAQAWPPAATLDAATLDAATPEAAMWSGENLAPHSRPENLAYVIYTSGSTGTPKGAMLTQRGMVNHLHAKIEDLELTHTDTIAQTASPCFDISVWQFLAGLVVGGRVVIVSEEATVDPARLLDVVAEHGVTVMETVPSLLRMMVEELGQRRAAGAGADTAHGGATAHATAGAEAHATAGAATAATTGAASNEARAGRVLGGLRWMIATGEALSPELCRRWAEVSAGAATRLLNAYGPTECSDDVTHYEVSVAPGAGVVRMPIGRAIGNTRLYVLNRELGVVPVGVEGELYVGGEGVGRGYLGEAGRTAESYVPDPYSVSGGARMYRTGDVVKYGAGGALEYVGRIDDQVKVRGYRIELGEVEAALRAQPEVREAVVVMREEGAGERRMVGYVVVEAGAESEEAAGDSGGNGTGASGAAQSKAAAGARIREGVRGRLAEYMIPQAVVVLAEMPLTANGKIDRRNLPAPDGWTTDETVAYVAPRTELEQQIAGIWQEVLKVEKVGLHDNFFDLGGHSIRMIEANGKLRLALGREVSVIDMFRHPTVRAMAEFLSQQQPEEIKFEENVERAGARRESTKRQREARRKQRA